MKFKEFPMGLYGWYDNNIGIFGGTRSDGFHPAGHMGSDFIAYDTAHKLQTGEDKEIAKLKFMIKFGENDGDEPSITKWIRIEVPKNLRKQGYGKRIVDAVKRIAPGDVEICDIKASAKGFWKKMGVENMASKGSYTYAILKIVSGPKFILKDDGFHFEDAKSECHLIDQSDGDVLSKLLSGTTLICESIEDNDSERWLLTEGGQFLRQTGVGFGKTYIADPAFAKEMLESMVEDKTFAALQAIDVFTDNKVSEPTI